VRPVDYCERLPLLWCFDDRKLQLSDRFCPPLETRITTSTTLHSLQFTARSSITFWSLPALTIMMLRTPIPSVTIDAKVIPSELALPEVGT
jgi:hypothetical protein